MASFANALFARSTLADHQGATANALILAGLYALTSGRRLHQNAVLHLHILLQDAASGCSLASVCNNLHEPQHPLAFYEPPVALSACLYYRLPYVPSSQPFLIFLAGENLSLLCSFPLFNNKPQH